MKPAQAARLSDGRLHLHHGPIDLIIDIEGDQQACEHGYRRAALRFEHLLDELCLELPTLRSPITTGLTVARPVAQRMVRAVEPFRDRFVTPMAAVAGSVADEILAHLVADHGLDKAYVNNGGDIAFHIKGGETFTVAAGDDETARTTISPSDPVRGIATSGWQGRSHSRGIADQVTVLATNAAIADAAATMIANAVDLDDCPTIRRQPAATLSPDSDLGDRLVTTFVGPLNANEINHALSQGEAYATQLQAKGLIHQARLSLKNQHRTV